MVFYIVKFLNVLNSTPTNNRVHKPIYLLIAPNGHANKRKTVITAFLRHFKHLMCFVYFVYFVYFMCINVAVFNFVREPTSSGDHLHFA